MNKNRGLDQNKTKIPFCKFYQRESRNMRKQHTSK